MALDPNNVILTIFVFLLAFHTLPSSKAGLVDDVCSHASPDPQFCRTAFASDSRSANADLPTLGLIGISLAQSHTKSSLSLLSSLSASTSDPKLKEIYGSCSDNYNEASGDLNDCASALNSKDYEKMNLDASAALNAPGTCDSSFSQPPEPAELKQAGTQVQTLSSALAYIANGLLQGHL